MKNRLVAVLLVLGVLFLAAAFGYGLARFPGLALPWFGAMLLVALALVGLAYGAGPGRRPVRALIFGCSLLFLLLNAVAGAGQALTGWFRR